MHSTSEAVKKDKLFMKKSVDELHDGQMFLDSFTKVSKAPKRNDNLMPKLMSLYDFMR